MDEPRDFCLKWSDFQNNLSQTFDNLRKSENFVDVTLSAGGRNIQCHKVSPFHFICILPQNFILLFSSYLLNLYCKHVLNTIFI